MTKTNTCPATKATETRYVVQYVLGSTTRDPMWVDWDKSSLTEADARAVAAGPELAGEQVRIVVRTTTVVETVV